MPKRPFSPASAASSCYSEYDGKEGYKTAKSTRRSRGPLRADTVNKIRFWETDRPSVKPRFRPLPSSPRNEPSDKTEQTEIPDASEPSEPDTSDSQPSPLPPPANIWPPEQPTHHTKLHYGSLQDWNWYWETIPANISQKSQAQHFFTKKASACFLQSVAYFRAFPESDIPEVAFVGRSNVGKSSLLNAIVSADTNSLLARTSSTPGFTKSMNLYGVGPGSGVHYQRQSSGYGKITGAGGITIVDMPGYGEGSIAAWGLEIMKYLQARKQLRRVFVLIDSEHGIKDKDRSILASLRLGGISHQIILSKIDKIYIPKARDIHRVYGKRIKGLRPKGTLEDVRKVMATLRTEIQPPQGAGALGEILGCSSEVLLDTRGLGIDAVRVAILRSIGFQFRVDQHEVELTRRAPVVRLVKNNIWPRVWS